MDRDLKRREKIVHLLKDFALLEISRKNKIPSVISDYILQEYGLSDKPSFENLSDDELFEFVTKFEEFIKEKYKPRRLEDRGSIMLDSDSKEKFVKACETFQCAKSDYLDVILRLISLLNEIAKFREKYSGYLKQKTLMKKDELELLEKKLHSLKLQSFIKFYSENDAFEAHLRLNEILMEKYSNLKADYDKLIQLDIRYNQLKENKKYCDLLHTYKQLLRTEKKLEYMMKD